MVVTALVEEGQKTVTAPFFKPVCTTALSTASLISWMSALPWDGMDNEIVFTVMAHLVPSMIPCRWGVSAAKLPKLPIGMTFSRRFTILG